MNFNKKKDLFNAFFTNLLVMKSPDSHFYCSLITKGFNTLDENESGHAVRVSRAINGDTIELCDGLGHYAKAKIIDANPKACKVFIETIENTPITKPKLNLAIGCLKDDALEDVVFHAAQTEINNIIFLRTKYSQEPKNSNLNKLIRRSILKSIVSLKQSKKPWLTQIKGPIEFKEWINNYSGDLILCDINGIKNNSEINLNNDKSIPITIIIGPEGGLAPEEIELIKNFKKGNVQLIKLGNTRLRARTAALIALGKIL